MSKFCSKCGKELSDDSQFCDRCGSTVNGGIINQQTANEYKEETPSKQNNIPVWLVILIVVFFGGFFYLTATGELDIFNMHRDESSTTNVGNIEYQEITVDELDTALENNAALAQETYKGKYLEIKGKLGVIDSDLKYIGLNAINKPLDLDGVHCRLRYSKTKEKVKTLTSGQIIVVKGKVTDVGEVLGYVLDTYEIETQ